MVEAVLRSSLGRKIYIEMVVNRGGFYEMAQRRGTQYGKEWTHDGPLVTSQRKRDGLSGVAGYFNREGSRTKKKVGEEGGCDLQCQMPRKRHGRILTAGQRQIPVLLHGKASRVSVE